MGFLSSWYVFGMLFAIQQAKSKWSMAKIDFWKMNLFVKYYSYRFGSTRVKIFIVPTKPYNMQ